MADQEEPTETTLLIPKRTLDTLEPPLGTLEPGDAPSGVLPSTDGSLTKYASISKGEFRDEESQHSEVDQERKVQFEGIPEVKKQLKWILPAVSIGIFLSAGDQTIVVSSYGKIGSELEALSNTSWVATAYFLTLTSFQPLYGKLSDIFGRKPALLFGYAVFGIGTYFCGRARNFSELVVARAFAGIGGGGMTTVVSILMNDIVPLRERGTWQGIINIIYATGAGLGAPLGGILADSIGWRWAFYGQVPLCMLAFIAVLFVLDLPKTDSSDWHTKIRRVDFPGALVLVSAVFALLVGLDTGANDSWSSPVAISALCFAFPLFGLFVVVEQKYAAEPFAPGRIIFNRSLVACYLCNFFSFAGWLGSIYFMPLFWQAVQNFNATQAGLRLLPGIIAGVCGSLTGGMIMQRTGKYYALTIFAYSLLTVGMIPILLFTGLVDFVPAGIVSGLVVCGFGNGIGVTTSLIGLIANAAPQDQAVATACSYLFRSLGSVVGLSISATVVQHTLRQQLAVRLGDGEEADEIVAGVRSSLHYIHTLKPEIRQIVRDCYSFAISRGLSFMMAIVFFAAVSACFIREKRLSR